MRLSVIFSLIFLIAVQTFADKTAHIIYQDSSGEYIVETEGLPNHGYNPIIDDPSVMWSYNVEWPIYTTTSTASTGFTFAGTYLNDPREAELFSPAGGGIPQWVYSGTEFRVDGSGNGSVLSGADEHSSGVAVYKWTGPGNSNPDWTVNFPSMIMSSYGPYFEVSSDGSTIAALVYNTTDSRLLMFNSNSSTPVVDYTASGFGFPRLMQISADGRFAALRLFTDLIIYDRDLNAPRQIINIGYSTTPADISGDGDLVAYGWTSMNVLQWTGASYSTIWTANPAGYSLSKVSISEDGSTIAAGWYNSNFTMVKLVVYNSGSSTPLWTYNFPASSGVVQEYISDIELSTDGRYIIVGSYGDAANINPEVHIFDREAGATPIFTVDMPGSIFSVDISADGSYASACGKHVHANTAGHGGDICAIDLDLIPPEVDITLVPVNPPILIPAAGGNFGFNIGVENLGTSQATIDIWTMVTLPNGSEYGPIINFPNLTMNPLWVGNRDRTQNVPATAPSGNYTYDAYIGNYPGTVYAEDHFEFSKSAVEDGGYWVTGWECLGEEFESFDDTEGLLNSSFSILNCYPNPFNPQATISFELATASRVSLDIFNITGRSVGAKNLSPLQNQYLPAGSHSVVFNAEGLTSGVYFVRLEAGDFRGIQKLLLIK